MPYSSSSLPNYPFPPLSYIFPPLPRDIKSCLRQGDTQLFRRVKGEGLNNQIEPITTYRCTKILKVEGVIIYSLFYSPVPLRKRKRGQVSRQTPLLFGQKRKDAQKSNEGVDSAGGGGSLQRLPPLLLLIISRPLREKRETAKNWRRGGRSRNVSRKSGCSGFFKQYSSSRRRRKALLSVSPLAKLSKHSAARKSAQKSARFRESDFVGGADFFFFSSRDFFGVGCVAVCLWGGCGGVISHVRYYVGGWVSSSSSPPTCMKGKRSEGED